MFCLRIQVIAAMSEGDSSLFTLLQDSLRRMEEQLTIVCTDVEQLKRNQPPERAAQLPGDQQLSDASVQSTLTTPDPPVEGEDDDDDIITKPPSWEEQTELLENQQNPSPLDTLGKRPKGEKLSLTKVDKERKTSSTRHSPPWRMKIARISRGNLWYRTHLSPWCHTLTTSWQQSAQRALKLQIRRTPRFQHYFSTQLGWMESTRARS